MIAELKLAMDSLTETLYGFLVLPGNVLLSTLSVHFPGLAKSIGIEGESGNATQVLCTSIGLWLLFALIGWLVVLLFKDFARIANAMYYAVVYRISQCVGFVKTTLVVKLRGRFHRRKPPPMRIEPTLEFDDLDLKILQSASELAPGFTLSAPELAEKIPRRPAQIQQSLDKLFQSRMLDSAIASTDGFDNYRLTDSGAQFVAMWQRQQAPA